MPSRRVVIVGLSGATAAVLADLAVSLHGHGHGAPKASGTPTGAPPTDPYWRAAAVDERSLINAYETASQQHPALAATLALPLAHHRVHLAALLQTTASPTSVPPTTTSSGPAPDADSVAEHREILSDVMHRETTAADLRSAAAVKDRSGGLLLARIAAADAVHADYLADAIAAIKPPAPSSSSRAPLATSTRPAPPSKTTITPAPATTTPHPSTSHPPTSHPPRPSTSRPAPTTSTTPPPSSTASTPPTTTKR